jgi:hypothetical protein
MSEYIVGLTYTFTVYPKRTDLETWFKSYDVKGREVELDLYYSVPGYAENFLIDRGKIHTDEYGNIVEETVTYTGKFNHVGSLTLLLRAIPPDVYRGYETVSVRYPRLTIQITDEKGSPIEGVECLAYPEGWVSPLRGETDRNGIAVIDLRDPSTGGPILDKRIRVYARKSGYEKYPEYSLLGTAPSPIEMGGDTAITGVLHSIAVAPPPPKPPPPPPKPIKVYFEVYDAKTNAPLEGAEITVGEMPPIKTDSSGKAEIQLPSSGKYAVKVVKPGYRAWMESIDLIDGGKVVVKLLPEVAPPPPAPTPPPAKIPPVLTVDKPLIFEGEEVKFTVSPSDVDVDLYEVVRREGKIYAVGKVKTFRGETTYKPPLGEHIYAVVYDELWSNEVHVTVSPKPPPTPPTPPPPPPPVKVPPKLIVDRTAITEGETVKLTATPSDVEVELYEIVGVEKKYIQKFIGELTIKPDVGTHVYMVKYDELWSDPVTVTVSAKPPPKPPAKPTAKPNWNVAVTVSVGGEPVGLGEAEVTLMEVTPWQIERHNYGPVLTDQNGVAIFTGVAGAYYVEGEKYSDMTYEVTAKLRVSKKGLPAGSILKSYLTIMDETYRVST